MTSPSGGQKGRKSAQLGAIDPAALLELAKVAGYGTEKYARYNFLKGYDWSLSFDAAQRHLLAFWAGEDFDPESGLAHLGHAAWHCLAMLAFLQRGVGTDDRPKTPLEAPSLLEEMTDFPGSPVDEVMRLYHWGDISQATALDWLGLQPTTWCACPDCDQLALPDDPMCGNCIERCEKS